MAILDPITGKRVSVESMTPAHLRNGRQAAPRHRVEEQPAIRPKGEARDNRTLCLGSYNNAVEAGPSTQSLFTFNKFL